MSGHPLGVQTLVNCHAAEPWTRPTVNLLRGKARAWHAGGMLGRPADPVENRSFLQTTHVSLFLMPGLHEGQSADMLPLFKSDQSKFRRCYPSTRRRVTVSYLSKISKKRPFRYGACRHYPWTSSGRQNRHTVNPFGRVHNFRPFLIINFDLECISYP